jgi:hypothetical protein
MWPSGEADHFLSPTDDCLTFRQLAAGIGRRRPTLLSHSTGGENQFGGIADDEMAL